MSPRTITDPARPTAPGGVTVTDVHSRLGAARVARVVAPSEVSAVRDLVSAARRTGTGISAAGGRHSMGGQPFAENGIVCDTRSLDRVISFDPVRGTITVEAGIQWPALLAALERLQAGCDRPWTFRQKQTGADELTIGGALASNVHGRGLTLPPFVADVDAFELIDADSRALHVSRRENADLFALAVGGYGLFGIVTRVTLRLVRRTIVRRDVMLLDVDHLDSAFRGRIAAGYLYGDFQFAIDPEHRDFLRRGVFACYAPVASATSAPPPARSLSSADFAALLEMAHFDKTGGFRRYSEHYLRSSGQLYASDAQQLSNYPAHYHEGIDARSGCVGTEMISELYVPRSALATFLARTRSDFREHGTNVVYGTVRLIERDTETLLAWAREPWACVVFNLHVDHSPEGLARAEREFRRLIERARELRGSYYLTYHRFATREQVEACHPRFRVFLAAKLARDPRETFTSAWYRHHRDLFSVAESAA